MTTQTKQAWTPGPWTTSQQNGLCLYIVGQDEALAEVFRVEQTSGFDATLFANARLISKAPEMAELLREWIDITLAEFRKAKGREGEIVPNSVIDRSERLLADLEAV